MSETIPTHVSQSSRVHLVSVLQDGLVAGLIGAFVVALIHFVADVSADTPLRTPTILGRLVSGSLTATQGAIGDLQATFWFTCLHISLWVALGTVCSWLVSLVDAHPRLSAGIFGGLAFGFTSLLYVSGAFELPGLPPLHLWFGTLAGSAGAAGYLVRRHPKLAGHLKREHLTPTTIGELDQAMAHELAAVAHYQAASARHPHPALTRVLEEKRERVERLHRLVDKYDLNASNEPAPETPQTDAEFEACVRSAIAFEHQTLELYDRFLVASPDLDVRDAFLRLRYQIVDDTIPLLEDTLQPSRDV